MPTLSEKVIFNTARQIGELAAREAYLDEACQGDQVFRNRIEGLLKLHAFEKSFLETPLAGTLDDPLDDSVGPYRLLELIGEGGMGSVYRAEQTQPVKREVALKIIKPGMDSRQVVARFEAERQALALMDHPNIARFIDVGLIGHVDALGLAAQRPYFVMELVHGIPITEYCDQHRLTPRQRLELFVPVCRAVQHAHQKGVIHRDLKPSNVLVAQYDGRPVPKVIDFGLAKAVGPRLMDLSLATGLGTVMGTLEYMSPEQAAPNQIDVDTRSDIYSLGVLLYELLTSTTPLDRKRFQEAAWLEMLRMLREDEPPKPSTRLSTTEELPTIAANRGLEPKKLSGVVRGDLDWIVMKSLDKERARRYDTANGLAQDVERFLQEQPVEACPPTVGYKLKKFLRRNRGPACAAALITLALIGGSIGTTIGFFRADAERKRAVAAAAAERLARDTAEKRLTQIEKGNAILGSIFENLNPRSEKTEGKTPWVLIGERLDDAIKQLDTDAVGDPLTVARLQKILGRSLFNLGFPEKAVPLFLKAGATIKAELGPDHVETLGAINNLAFAYRALGKLDLALPLFEDSFRVAKEKLGSDHENTLNYLNNLASAYQSAEKLDRALPLFEESQQLRRAKYGADDARTLTAMSNLAFAYTEAGLPQQALPLLEESLRLRRAKLPPDHDDVLTSVNNLGQGYSTLGKHALSLPLFQEALEHFRQRYGPDHVMSLTMLHNVASAHLNMGKPDVALPLSLYAATAVEKRRFEHQNAAAFVRRLNECYETLKQYEAAELWRRKWLAVLQGRGDTASIAYATELALLGSNLVEQRKWVDAEVICRECLLIRQKLQPDVWTTFNVQSLVGSTLLGQKKYAEAEPFLLQGYDGLTNRAAKMPLDSKIRLTQALERLVRLYDEWDKPADADRWRRQLPVRDPN